MKRRRVKITGIGPVTPAGIGREAFWRGILESTSRIKAFTKLEDKYGPFVAGTVDRFHVEHYVKRSAQIKGAARHSLFAVAGAALAIRDAGLTIEEINNCGCVVTAGSALMDFGGIGETVTSVLEKQDKGGIGRTVVTTNTACIPALVGPLIGFHADVLAFQTACCAGIDAIGHAFELVASGEADLAICGGTEAPLYATPLVELRQIGLTPSTTVDAAKLDRPFDLWRTTGVVSEGAAMLVLEPESSPRRGYCFISGYDFASDGAGRLCGGIVEAAHGAIANAGLRPREIEMINAWGPGHREIDAAEAKQLGEVFGEAALREIPAASIKGALGNPLGAAGAIQVATAALALAAEEIPPTVNWEHPDPACPLNLSNRRRRLAHACTLVNAHGLTGVNSAVVLERC